MDESDESQDAGKLEAILTSIPPMPAVRPGELLKGSPFVFGGQGRHWMGWKQFSDGKGGASFVVLRRTLLDNDKVIERFPMTEEGWAQAWRTFVRLDARSAYQVLRKIAARSTKDRIRVELPRLDAETINYLPAVIFLGGHTPGVELMAGGAYDLRFLDDRLAIIACRHVDPLIEIPYTEVEAVNIGGAGLIKSGGGFIGGGFGVGAVAGIATAAVLNSMTTKFAVETLVQIQAGHREVFLLHTVLDPDKLRIELSSSFAAIRHERTSQSVMLGYREAGQQSSSKIDALDKLASLLERGLLTRDEFDNLKAKLITEL